MGCSGLSTDITAVAGHDGTSGYYEASYRGVCSNHIRPLWASLVILIAFSSIFALSVFPTTVSATTYLEVFSKGIMQPSSNITITGQIVNTSASDTIENVNISANVSSGGSGYGLSDANGEFAFNITAPGSVGETNVSVYTNESSPHNKTIPIYVSNITSASVDYYGDLPPYSASDKIYINVTFYNGSAPATSYPARLGIYKANGKNVTGTWTVTALFSETDGLGVIPYEITVPADADPGHYVMIVDRGIVASVFGVQSGYKLLVDPKTSDGEIALNFEASSTVMIMARVKTVGDVAVSSGISSVNAYVEMPNGTVSNLTLIAVSQSAYPGYYNNNFTATSNSGEYKVRVEAQVDSDVIEGYTFFEVKSFNARLEPETDFFKEWGGSSAFGAGDTVGLNIVATNLTDDSVFVTPTHIPACNTTYLTLVDVFFPNGTSVNSSITNAMFVPSNFFMNQICGIKFTAPSASSAYGIKVNVTVGGVTETAKGYFLIQKYFLKPTLVAGFGGEMEMMDMVAPGENATITLSAYNITNDEAVSGANISSVSVKKIKPIEFDLGIADITERDGINYSVSYGATPTITLEVPESVLGAVVVEIEANVAGETVRGHTFFISNYLSGFLMPSSMGGPGGGGPEEGDDGGPPVCSCSGLQVFDGTVLEVKTGQAVGSGAVTINGILEASEEFTDKDVSSYVTLSSTGTSDSDGKVSVNITFSQSYSFSGFYFILLNATYQGKSSGIPAGFVCKNLKFWPETYSVGGKDQTWRIAPDSGVNVVIRNITRANDSMRIRNATVQIPMIYNFNPSKGGERILMPTSGFASWSQSNWTNWTSNGPSWNVTSNLANFTVYPENFTLGGKQLTRWPNGFIDLEPVICTESLGDEVDPTDTSTWGCDLGFGGFQIVPFDAWPENFEWGTTTAVNTSESYIISVKSNVSLGCTGTTCDRAAGSLYISNSSFSNNTGFTVKIGRPWEGGLTDIKDLAIELINDGWNTGSDKFGEERWRINFTIPATIKKGEAMILFTVNNSYGETTDVEIWTTFTKYTIRIPYEEGLEQWWGMDNVCNSTGYYGNDGIFVQFETGITWNLTYLNETFGLSVKDCSPSSIIAVYPYSSFTVNRRSGSDNQYTLNYHPNMTFLLINNNTASLDTLVMNLTNSTLTNEISWADLGNRTVSKNAYNKPGIYLVKIEGQYVKLANASAVGDTDIYGELPTWGGQSEVNKLHTIPYIVTLGSNPIVSAEVHANGVIEQTFEGKGFESKLVGGYDPNGLIATGENYSYITDTTDSMGMAFLRVNVSSSGRYNLFWKVNTSEDYDMATFSSGTQIELRKFKGWGDATYLLPERKVTMYWANNTPGYPDSPVWYAYPPSAGGYVYNSTVVESSLEGFVRDSATSTWRIVYNWTNNETCFDDDANFTYGNPYTTDDTADYPVFCFYINQTSNNINMSFGAEENTRIGLGSFKANATPQGDMTFVFYQEDPRPSGYTASQINPNVSVRVCAETFDVPQSLPIEHANIKLYAMNFEVMGPPERTWLTMYDPLNGTKYEGGASEPESGIFTSPKGCVVFKMAYEGGWPESKCTEVQGKVIRGSDAEEIWVGRVCA